jgi:hypothetical protein
MPLTLKLFNRTLTINKRVKRLTCICIRSCQVGSLGKGWQQPSVVHRKLELWQLEHIAELVLERKLELVGI